MSSELEFRMARLERENRYLIFSGMLLLLFLVSGVAYIISERRAKIGDVVVAGRYEVIDAKGQKRVTLGITDRGEPFLDLTGSDNSKHILISIRPEGSPFIVIGDLNTPQHLSLYGPTPQSEGGIDITKAGKSIAEMRVSQEGTPRIILRDKEEKVIWKAP